jgi:hypothetical protein
MTYQLPQPRMTAASWRLLDELHRTGAPLKETITMTVEGAPASISPAPVEAVRGPAPRQQLSCTYGPNTTTVLRIEIAMQAILADAIRARSPAPVVLDELEVRRLPGLVADVDAAVVVYRDLLRRRTGVAWSVRVGSGKHRSTITIASEPKARVAGMMTARDCALLAALTDRAMVNPASGLAVGNTITERQQAVFAFSGVDILAWQRRLG